MNNLKSGSKLEKLLASGQFVVTGELGPPKSVDISTIDDKIKALSGAVDAVNITDNQTAIVRISSIGTACYVMAHGLEPIVQMTCRDRNRLAIQADLLGAYLNGARNLLCLTGDHQIFGNHPQAKQVYDVDSMQLIRMVRDMRDEQRFQCGEEIRNSKKAEMFEPRFLHRWRGQSLCRSHGMAGVPPGEEDRRGGRLHPDPVHLRHGLLSSAGWRRSWPGACTRRSRSSPASPRSARSACCAT